MSKPGAPDVSVRDGRRADMADVCAIYGHHVVHGLASFEETPPDLAEMTRRFEAVTAQGLPYLVATAEVEGIETVAGYAYAGRYRPRPAYRFTVENSVYVAPQTTGRGIGRALLETLIRRCETLGYRQMIAIIGDRGNAASIRFHEASGFIPTGHLHAVGFKWGRWVDSVLMQRALGAGEATIPGEAPHGWRP